LGLKLRYSLFYEVSPNAVYEAYRHFYTRRHFTFSEAGELSEKYELYVPNAGWTILGWNSGWEWDIRREAQLFVSRELHCPGFLIFVYDGDYWGYEFFSDGVVLDHFVQDMEEGKWHFPSDSCTGNAQLLADNFDWLTVENVMPYLVQDPQLDKTEPEVAFTKRMEYREYVDKLNIPPRPSDEYSRFSELAVLNFLRLLGIRIGVVDKYVVPQTAIWREFWVNPPVKNPQ
jgi:hypothetical protein